ncbi:ssDNA-binding domain-containing protein [Mucilaginibacter sp. UR6-1]|uniref:ArdC family protein n=1 Tax=Mucilaginibacter sp. UR6-1 TaxID=1435643 RepID=UPI001E50B05B|nr:zincin-like metallopeptidase domain-containing protein [Mucilaginibacter sp. UR6-1]MCC8407697.1 ssDNA-binding domain-containing protein [Mucilaginibacter sp. UR6-1]
MSKNFKPLYAQLAEKLIAEFKAGTSPYQKPVKDNGRPAFVTPVNPITGKGYSALNALNLSMRGHDDPRWMSADAASFNGYLVKEGSKGTLINFPKRSEIQAIRTPDGAKVKDDAGVTQTKTVEFDKVQNGKAFLFNAEQIRDIPPLEDFLKAAAEQQPLSPVERAEKLIAETGAVIVHGGHEAYYDKAKDEIHLPEREAFENETKYLQAAIHQLAHWTGHESRLNRPMEGRFASMDYAREELRAATAAMLIGGELKIGHSFGQHAAYTGAWSKILKDEPFELSRAAADAQKIVGILLNAGQKREEKEGAAVSNTLRKGEEIAYNDTTYKVLDKKGKSFEIEKADTGERFKVKPTDKVFLNLVEARNNPQGPSHSADLEIAGETEQTHKIGR